MELKRKVCLGVRFHCVLSLTELPFHSTSSVSVQYHRNSVTQLHSCSTAGAAVFVVGVCMCVFVCVHGRGQLSKATTNMATEVVPCSFVYLCCCVFL